MRRRQLLAWSALGALGTVEGAAVASVTASATASVNASAAAPVLTRVDTALGAFVVEVHPDVAPLTVANYLAYVDGRHLDGASVYRIVTLANQAPDTAARIEVVQWGMNLPDDRAPPWPPIRHETTRETGLRHRDGTVSMARSAPGTAASEFFICIGDQPELDHGGRRNPDGQGFAAFGQVVGGREVVARLFGQGQAQQFLAAPIPVHTVRRVRE